VYPIIIPEIMEILKYIPPGMICDICKDENGKEIIKGIKE
jgi:hypothetical protein